MKKVLGIVALISLLGVNSLVWAEPEVRGISLTEIGDFKYDASTDLTKKTEAQKVVDKLFDLGVRQINLSPRAIMKDPRKSEVLPLTPASERTDERQRYLRFIRYIQSKGMDVGMRPIFFVVDAKGRTPYEEVITPAVKKPNGEVVTPAVVKAWWHGNIQPEDPNEWFKSFRTYLDIYLPIAKVGRVKEFTIGAELYSMTVGLEDQWPKHPHGFPGPWLELLNHVRSRLAKGCRIMYDINFTDAKVGLDAKNTEFGGEFARWRYRIVDLADKTKPEEKQIWQNVVDFWNGLDAIGIDMYRSLATHAQALPKDREGLVRMLQDTAERYATQIDSTLFEIESAVGKPKKVILKEIGFRSVDNCFIDPFVYAGDDNAPLNIAQQAASYEAIFRAFWKPNWPWLQGIVLWDASVSPELHGLTDRGFSPIGKPATEEVLRAYYR